MDVTGNSSLITHPFSALWAMYFQLKYLYYFHDNLLHHLCTFVLIYTSSYSEKFRLKCMVLYTQWLSAFNATYLN